MNFEKKKKHIKKWLKSPTHRWKTWSRNRNNKLRGRRNVVEKSQSESKKFDAIDVGQAVARFLSSVLLRLSAVMLIGEWTWSLIFTLLIPVFCCYYSI